MTTIPQHGDALWVADAIREDNSDKSAPWSASAEFLSEAEAASAEAQLNDINARARTDIRLTHVIVEFEPDLVNAVAHRIVMFHGTLTRQPPRVVRLGEKIKR